MLRTACILLFAAGASLPGAARPAAFVHAIEFPYEKIPRVLWERELVWMKNIGVGTVAFSIPAQDAGWREFIRLLRRLEMRAWIRKAPPPDLDPELAPQLARHGGPIAFIEAPPGRFDAPPPPAPVVVSATDPTALARSRQALAGGHGALLWTDVEDSLYPAYRKGVVSLSGEERPGAGAVRRSASLLRHWAALIPLMQPRRAGTVRLPNGALPPQVSAIELTVPGPDGVSAVSLVNQSARPFASPLRVYDPRRKAARVLPPVKAGPGQALWLPVDVPLAYGGLCRDCIGFPRRDRLVYATAELHGIEYENGILALEFSAPAAGEAVLELSTRPVGPYLAAGSPAEFEWDEKTLTARLPIPAGQGAGHRVRVGLAIAPPEHTGFFVNPVRLVIGRKNLISTSYSSAELAGRSRLLAPPGYQLQPRQKSPTEIDYEVSVPATALHGEFVELALEADGVRLGRARLQVFGPASVRLREAAALHFGQTELRIEPPLVSLDPRAGRSLDILIRNNAPSIETFTVKVSGDSLEFLPAQTELSVGAIAERSLAARVFGPGAATGIYLARIELDGAARVDQPFRVAAIRRGEALAYSLDLDGDESPEWVLENQKVRAVFSARAGGRWLEFVWKDTGSNALPEAGAFPGAGPVEFRITSQGREASLEIAGAGWRRQVRLAGGGAEVRVEQDVPLPAETLASGKAGDILFRVSRPDPRRATYSLERVAEEGLDRPQR